MPTSRSNALLFGMLVTLAPLSASAAPEQLTRVSPAIEAVDGLIAQLDEPEKVPEALDALVTYGSDASPQLSTFASQRGDMSARGWAIVALSRIGDEIADDALTALQQDSDPLIQVWASAARIALCEDMNALALLARELRGQSALARPLLLKVQALVDTTTLDELLSLARTNHQLQAPLAEVILGFAPEELVEEMLTHPDQDIRRQAAAYVATLGKRDPSAQQVVLDALDYTTDRETPPWWGGPLWIPSMSWQQQEAQALVGHLIAWHLYCEHNGYEDAQVQIENNLRSVGLLSAADMGTLYDLTTASLLNAWGNTMGRDALEAMLREQGLHREKEYKLILNRLE